ncbi:MAG: nucleoside recognition protein [Eubacteriales bacterium]|nr:nucleoside recognition protein [Eubacteriales bacterium]
MTYLWGGMILLGILYGTITGNLQAVTEAAISSSKEAVTLCISMAGITAMWTGMMKIAEMTGLVEQLSRGLRPVLRFLFPQLDPDSKACRYISLNFLSNLLGLNWASTSSGLMAFKELDRINKEDCKKLGTNGKRAPHIASPAMCTFLIINVSSLQLIPVNMIAYRTQYGSAQPAAIVGPAIIATGISTLAAVAFCWFMNKRTRSGGKV